jgi:LDH2 family malate/lactate/ureidoglycolate dehydrogenase
VLGLLRGEPPPAPPPPPPPPPPLPYDCSHLFIAIDVAHFGDPATVRAAATAAGERIRSGKRAPGVAQLFAPGEREWRQRQGAVGQVHLTPAVAELLTRLAREMRVSAVPLARDDEHPVQETGHAQA